LEIQLQRKEERMRTVMFVLSITILLLLGGDTLRDVVAEGTTDKIIFLHLRFENETIILDSLRVRPGTLKERSITSGERGDGWIHYVMRSEDDSRIGEGILKDPRLKFRSLEYEDPRNPGALMKIHVREEPFRFLLRIPYTENLSHVEFFKSSLESSTNRRSRNTIEEKIMSRIQINLEDAK
jgi:hypothetical protein